MKYGTQVTESMLNAIINRPQVEWWYNCALKKMAMWGWLKQFLDGISLISGWEVINKGNHGRVDDAYNPKLEILTGTWHEMRK